MLDIYLILRQLMIGQSTDKIFSVHVILITWNHWRKWLSYSIFFKKKASKKSCFWWYLNGWKGRKGKWGKQNKMSQREYQTSSTLKKNGCWQAFNQFSWGNELEFPLPSLKFPKRSKLHGEMSSSFPFLI